LIETAKHVVGIDLGTTNTVVASFAVEEAEETSLSPDVLRIPQLVTAREVAARPLLPSCLYAPLAGEVQGDPEWICGELARRRGSEISGRFVASAKSWLCHAGVDRLAPILPWGTQGEQGEQGEPDAPRISPLDASTRYLVEVKMAWDRAHPDAPLAKQDVILTVPASFDEVARELTVRAAEAAGLTVTIVEEPTAAFYDAMRDDSGRERSNTAWDKLLGRVGKKDVAQGLDEQFVLVCDVGGGTTDLSLMAVGARKKGEAPPIRRVAVGRHILLGGDNMDLALAHLAESRIGQPGSLSATDLAQLVLACRDAKERIFGGAREARVTVLGRGGKLIGGAKSTTLTADDVRNVVVSGFFPRVEKNAEPSRARGGLVSFGLPYERDVAITRHVAQFLSRHAAEMNGRGPDAILLNGGVFLAGQIRDALVSVVTSWSEKEPALLPNADPDLAVARGAVLYGFARRGKGIRVASGASHGYYVALDDKSARGAKRAVCIIPRGAEEGVFQEAKGKSFELLVGQSVRFELHASDVRRDKAGALVDLPEAGDDSFERLPPLVARVNATKGERAIPVTLGGVLTPAGTLELFCTNTTNTKQRVRLELQLKADARASAMSAPAPPPASLAPAAPTGAGVAASKLDAAKKLIERSFGKRGEADSRETKELSRDLEKILGDRLSWTMDTVRDLADQLMTNPGGRRRSSTHERMFFMLTGFCLRPGFGDPKDQERVRVFSTLFEGRLAFPDESRGWQQFFIAWRRVAGGTTDALQLALRDAFDPCIAPREAGLGRPKRMPGGLDELSIMLASLERVAPERRAALGEWLIERTWSEADPRLWSAIGRVGARVPLYASLHHVVAPRIVEPWIERLLREDWNRLTTAAHAAVQLARVTDDRARDVSTRLREAVERKLRAANAKQEWISAVRERADLSEAEKVAVMGEGLPIGLRLAV
jgi:molecular chaperone DnaK (HSP70)